MKKDGRRRGGRGIGGEKRGRRGDHTVAVEIRFLLATEREKKKKKNSVGEGRVDCDFHNFHGCVIIPFGSCLQNSKGKRTCSGEREDSEGRKA